MYWGTTGFFVLTAKKVAETPVYIGTALVTSSKGHFSRQTQPKGAGFQILLDSG